MPTLAAALARASDVCDVSPGLRYYHYLTDHRVLHIHRQVDIRVCIFNILREEENRGAQ